MPGESPIGVTLAGKFLVKRLIGKGGMGAVYEGSHVEIGKRIAIKLIDPEHSRSEEIADRFRQEARAASRVESDHIVQVFDVGQDPTWGLYMVMEYLTGEDLAGRIARDGPLPVPVALDIAYQSARGLAKAHAVGVIHRDLKPANIFLTARDDGLVTVKLVDFGISKVISGDHEKDDPKRPITRWGSAVGTPQYMSPEQAQGQAVDHRCDVWALGACLYEMLCGKQAYQLLESYEQTIFAIVLRKPPPLEELAPEVPAALVGVVGQALEKDLELRIPDCATFAKMLAAVSAGAENDAPASRVARDASRILRPVQIEGDPSKPDAIVIPDGQRDPSVDDRSALGATQPLAPALSPPVGQALAAAHKNSLQSRPAPKETLRGVAEPGTARGSVARQPPPTVSGVSVRTDSFPDLSAPGIDDEANDLRAAGVPRRRGGATMLVLLALVAGLGAVAFVGPRRWPQQWPPWASWTSWHLGGESPSTTTARDAPPPTVKPRLAATTNATTNATSALPSATGSSAASGSASIAPSGAPSTKASAKKPGGKPLVGAPSASTSASADPGQFGGTGVSSDY